MNLGNKVADRLEKLVTNGFDILKISQEAFKIYQDPDITLTQDLNMALLSLVAMQEGPEFVMTEREFHDLLFKMRKM